METFTTTTRKVGNSVGLLIPKEVLEKENMSEGWDVEVTISAKVSDNLFGRFKDRWSARDVGSFVEGNKDAWGD
ncbi:MAG: hypothetical protein JXB14_06530 [Candidatus Altiarchaeota archaeon]|nr:hypothetical protein [Candidatus Altiarchaeota archaeon]